MLTPESYQTAWLFYALAALGGLAYLYFLLRNHLSRGARVALVLILAGLVLTPAHPAEDIKTWAPALFVAGFELLTSGAEAAARPARSLVAAEAIAVGLCLLGWIAHRLLGRKATSSS